MQTKLSTISIQNNQVVFSARYFIKRVLKYKNDQCASVRVDAIVIMALTRHQCPHIMSGERHFTAFYHRHMTPVLFFRIDAEFNNFLHSKLSYFNNIYVFQTINVRKIYFYA